MKIDILFDGIIGIVLGTVIGSLITVFLTYQFQKKLLRQQLDFQKEQSKLDAAQREQFHADQMAKSKEFGDMFYAILGDISKKIAALPKGGPRY